MSLEGNVSLIEPQAAQYLGFSISKLRRLRRERRGPAYVQVDRSIRYRKPALDAFLEKHTVASQEQPNRPETAPRSNEN